MGVRVLRTGIAVSASALALLAPCALAAGAGPSGAASSNTVGRPLHGLSYWGGYGAHGATFESAKASWTIPAVSCRTHYEGYSSWVGMDGDGTRIVEQTGVNTDCASGQPLYHAWYQVYPDNRVDYGDPISTGDTFTASVTADGTSFTLTISDETQGWTESVTKSAPSAPKATAEAVIESTPGLGYPTIPSERFFDVRFNGQPLDSFADLVKYKTRHGSPIIYRPSKITHHTDFTIKPSS
jgi:hypothetical protein